MQCRFYSHITFVRLGKRWAHSRRHYIFHLCCWIAFFTIAPHGLWVVVGIQIPRSTVKVVVLCLFFHPFFTYSILLFHSDIQMLLEFYHVKLGTQGPLSCIPEDAYSSCSLFALVLRHKPFSFVWATLVAINDFPYGIAWFCNTVCVSVDLLKTEDIFLWPENGVVGGLRWYLLVVVRVLWNQKVVGWKYIEDLDLNIIKRALRIQKPLLVMTLVAVNCSSNLLLVKARA